MNGRSIFLDIAPTVLDLLSLPPLLKAEGISLKPYLFNPQLAILDERSLMLESAFSAPEIEHEGIDIGEVAAKNFSLFAIDPKSGQVSISQQAARQLLMHKQRAILHGEWLLAYYPASTRYKELQQASSLANHAEIAYETYLAPPFFVLLNLKSGKWTSDLNSSLAANAPLKLLNRKLADFYGVELTNYSACCQF